MKHLGWVLKLALFAMLLGFGLRNAEPVTVRYFFDAQWQVPLSLVLLLFFAAGAALGVIAGLARIYQQRREIMQLRSLAQASERPKRERAPLLNEPVV